MFKNNYQGGAVVEIFSGQGKDPVAKWKLCGGPSAIRKEYNKEVKGFVYCLEGSSQTVKMQMPENGKMSLGLLQRFLVLQVNIPQFNDFSTELVITDSEHQKRRLYLSTVHKELSATLLHAKIPLVGLKRNIWCTLCVDLVSLTGELFKGFLTLDGITLFATCKVRRIFTMKAEPTGISDDDMSLSGAGLMDLIPRSCQYPADVSQVTQVLNMENLQKADMRTGLSSPGCAVSDHSATARSMTYRRARPRGVLHTASGFRAPGPYPQTERKSNATSDAIDDDINNMGPMSSGIKQKVTEGQNITYLSENISHGECSHVVHEALGASGSLQPHPPQKRVFDKQGSKKLRVRSAGRERTPATAPPGGVSGVLRNSSKSREKRTPPLCGQGSRQQPLTLTEKSEHLAAGEPHISYESCCSLAKESSGVTPTPAETGLSSIRPGLSSDLQVRSSWESNEESEPQLTLQEEVFTFSSQPHSPKRGQGQGDQEKMEMGDDRILSKRGRRYDAQPEDDFIGSESDEDKGYIMFQHQNTSRSTHATSRMRDSTLSVQLEEPTASPDMKQASPEELSPPNTSLHNLSIGRTEPAGMVPTRCLSPDRQEHKFGVRGSEEVNRLLNRRSSVSLCRRFLQEVKLDDSQQHKEEDDETLNPVDSSHYDLHLLGRLRMQGDDDEELRMLASLKREQEEDECRASGLSASQIHQCNVSISMSSDDTSTWTHVSMPANQGHHYQKEMTTLQQSNPRENSSELRRDSNSSGNKSTELSTREWMDVLSPPIMPPSQQRRSGNTWSNLENLVRGGDEQEDEGENEDEYLNLLYDPCLNCYFDPKTGKYYELA